MYQPQNTGLFCVHGRIAEEAHAKNFKIPTPVCEIMFCWVHDSYTTETYIESLKGLQVLPPLAQDMSASENVLLPPPTAWTGPASKGPIRRTRIRSRGEGL